MAKLTEDIRSDLTKIFSERDEVQEADSGLKVNFHAFIEWYFSDRDDYVNFARNIISDLNEGDPVSITPESLFGDAEYIPGWIVDGGDEDKEYSPSELKLYFRDY